jgi:C4-dicarboxylate transporter DctM subunit
MSMTTTMTLMAFGLLFLGVPVWLIFLSTSIVAIYFFTNVPMEIVVTSMFGSLDNFVLLAVPGFIFAGEVMGRGGMTDRMIRWVRSFVGPVPGGVPVSTLGAVTLFSAISGSSTACTAAMGKVLYPALRESRYSERFSLGLLTASGAIDVVIPPSITMVLYSAVTNASLGKLFLAGFIPGLLLMFIIGGYSIWVSYREGIVGQDRWSGTEIWSSSKDVIWTLGAPILIFGGIYSGWFTPTEAAAVACIYTIFVSLFVYRELNWKGLWQVALDSSHLTAKVFVISAAASLFTWVLTIANVPPALASGIDAMALPPWAVLLMINLVILVAGMFLDPVSIVLALTPILWPIAQAIGLNEIHFGIIYTMNIAIGMFTPPFGLNLFVASSVFKVPISRIVPSVMPFLVCYVIGLGLITYVPAISMWLPNLMGQ